ncbi:MAG: hypothetical protein LIQ31_09265 [Planctomycetes bacterium]|nr:hypothetical protein [Planctomycetota bacterium]
MLRQEDFVEMLGSMQTHVEKTIRITDELVSELDDVELRFKLVAFRQAKHLHLETLSALQTLVRHNMYSLAGDTLE